jgi:hypothetical protein
VLSCLGNAYAADPYDGEWTGSAAPIRHPRCTTAQITLRVSDNVALGEAKFDAGVRNIRGTVHPDGTVGATIGFQHLTGKFVDDRFEGRFEGGECAWTVILRRTRARGPTSFGPLQRFASGVPMLEALSLSRFACIPEGRWGGETALCNQVV